MNNIRLILADVCVIRLSTDNQALSFGLGMIQKALGKMVSGGEVTPTDLSVLLRFLESQLLISGMSLEDLHKVTPADTLASAFAYRAAANIDLESAGSYLTTLESVLLLMARVLR